MEFMFRADNLDIRGWGSVKCHLTKSGGHCMDIFLPNDCGLDALGKIESFPGKDQRIEMLM